jgi:hypothetical protein
MAKDLVRGYLVTQTLEFVQTRCTLSQRERVEAGLSKDFRAALGGLTPGGWFPREHMAEALSALATTTSEDARYELFVACGQFISQRTTNEYTSLMFGILTPELFVKKVPRFWQRDHQGGARLELDTAGTTPGIARLELTGVEGYDHIGVVWLGWMKGALAQMHSAGVDLRQNGWSPAEPAPSSVQYEVRWS